MTLTLLSNAEWPALRSVVDDNALVLARTPLTGCAPRVASLDIWLTDTLLPLLRAAFPAATVSDDILAAAGLLAWLNQTASPPPGECLVRIEAALSGAIDDPPAHDGAFVAPVKMVAVEPERRWCALAQRMLAFAGGWGRTVGAAPWDRVWSRAVLEFTSAAIPQVEHILKKLWRTAWGVEAAMRPRIGCVAGAGGWVETPEYFDWLTGTTAAATTRFLAPLPLEPTKTARFLHLQGWNPAKGSLYLWMETMLEGEANTSPTIRTNAFRYGALAQTIGDLAAARRTGQRICWSKACRLAEIEDPKKHKRARRPWFFKEPCPKCGEVARFLDVLVEQERMVAPDEFEEFSFSRCKFPDSKPEHFVILRPGHKPGAARCPLHLECDCSQGVTKLWLQMPPSGEDIPGAHDESPQNSTDDWPADELTDRFADPIENFEQ